jgi:hypothetical protein
MSILHKIAFTIGVICLLGCARERDIRNEKYYQNIWCAIHQGRTEVILADRSRCDGLTAEYAIEVDFAGKWEALEQALHYARLTGKKRGSFLSAESPMMSKKYAELRKTSDFINCQSVFGESIVRRKIYL